MASDKGVIIRKGNIVRINGVHGFGLVKEIVWCIASQKCVFLVLITLLGSLKEAELVTLCPSDCSLYHSDKSAATVRYATQDEHEFYALEMAA